MKLLVALVGTALLAADEVPQWVTEAAAKQGPTFPAKVSALVLLQEEHLTVDAEGRRTFRERGAIRVLQQGADVTAYRTYNARSGRIRDFQAWLLPPGGKPAAVPRNAITDAALSASATYDEGRMKMLDAGARAVPGTVFAWEIVEEEKTIFTQYHYSFQDSEPVLTSRFVLSLPPGWEVRGTVWNHPAIEPAVSGLTWTWETRDLGWIEDEDYSPDSHALAPRLAISYYPASNSNPALRPLKDWAAVSSWTSGFFDPSAEVTAAIRHKAAELTKDAASELDRIRAIARFAQQTNYVSVQMNLTRGGGYTPHRASEVLERNYGDCKDKATVMRALLSAAGIESWPVAIYWGDRDYVRPEWPSSLQFNHAIIAIRVSPETKLPTVLAHPKLGRLLIFDPTSTSTPLGDLPDVQQASHALVLAGDKGELVQMPVLPAARNRVESRVEAQLVSDGSLTARVAREYFGQPAARLRGITQKPEDLKRSLEVGLSRRLGGMTLNAVTPSDQMQDGTLQLNLDIAVKSFGKLMQERLLVLEPGSLVQGIGYSFPAKPRKWPVRLSASLRKDTVTIDLPPEFKPDEIPEVVVLESRWGKYLASWSVSDGKLAFAQSLEVRDTLSPASEYGKIREFFESVAGAQSSAVVLIRR